MLDRAAQFGPMDLANLMRGEDGVLLPDMTLPFHGTPVGRGQLCIRGVPVLLWEGLAAEGCCRTG